MGAAPKFRYPSPDGHLLEKLAAGYTRITGEPARRPAQRNLIATCHRVQGDRFLPLVERLFGIKHSTTNLLGEIRLLAPDEAATLLGEEPDGGADRGPAAPPSTPAAAPLPNLIYSEADRVPFTPGNNGRLDRRPSNPDAARFFSDEELGMHSASSTARALAR